jgi:hypothetical protein
MKFFRNGPDVPDRLLQAHEDGKVVFFCGAGISYPAGLPGFEELVKTLYENLGVTPSAVQRSAIKARQFDSAIGLLEFDDYPGREAVRREIARILKTPPHIGAPDATATHAALLRLGRLRGNGGTRLITTNFDRLFEEVRAKEVACHKAPLLPVPKNSWDGLVYLHGLITPEPTVDELNQLVVTSGDFGRAYLVERWASRFVGELFRRFTVCFVGYSIDDPILRYMMDALAADKLLGERTPEMFAFAVCSKGKEERCANEWRRKNVTPILYSAHKHHAYFHRTLQSWAETYERGKERIVSRCAKLHPMDSTEQDDFVGRLIWAISDRSGLPAKRFADFNPVPTIDWLEYFAAPRFRKEHLAQFRVQPGGEHEPTEFKFSLIERPPTYWQAPMMSLFDACAPHNSWDNVMQQLAAWLTRHLNDPVLALWLAGRGGRLNDQFLSQIEHKLAFLADLERTQGTEALDRIRADAPKAVAGPHMCTIWRLFSSGLIKSRGRTFDLFSWVRRLNRNGLTATLRLELRDALAPRVVLREKYAHVLRVEDRKLTRSASGVDDLVEWEIVLAADHVDSLIRDLRRNKTWIASLPILIHDFGERLRDALDLINELGGEKHVRGRSDIYVPSILEDDVDRRPKDWTALIDLARDAWLAIASSSPEIAWRVAQLWWDNKYPVFKRLALFAAAKGDVVPHDEAVAWLLSDESRWLWCGETSREVLALLSCLAKTLSPAAKSQLEGAVLKGPSRESPRYEVSDDQWPYYQDGRIWERLRVLSSFGTPLGANAAARFNRLAAKHPDWLLRPSAEESKSDFSENNFGERKPALSPLRLRDLVEWIKANPTPDFWHPDNWSQRCSDDFPATACALRALAAEGIWPAERWRSALHAWSDERLHRRSWRRMGLIVAQMPDNTLSEVSRQVAWWLNDIARSFEGHQAHYDDLCHRLLHAIESEDSEGDDPVFQAINHTVGLTTEALVRLWFRSRPQDDQGLPERLRAEFSQLCDVNQRRLRHGRVVLATYLVPLFRVDPGWSSKHLLPLLQWHRDARDAREAWQGFLRSPRLHRGLMGVIKDDFLGTAAHYEELGDYGRQYVALLTYAGLDRGETFKMAEVAKATRALSPAGLRDAAETLVRAIEGEGPRGDEYWRDRISPYMRSIWPSTRERTSDALAESLGRVCIAAGEEFPDALRLLRPWLRSPEWPEYLVHRLHESGHCTSFPDDSLAFLELIMGTEPRPVPSELRLCLDAIASAKQSLIEDHRFERLMTPVRLRE